MVSLFIESNQKRFIQPHPLVLAPANHSTELRTAFGMSQATMPERIELACGKGAPGSLRLRTASSLNRISCESTLRFCVLTEWGSVLFLGTPPQKKRKEELSGLPFGPQFLKRNSSTGPVRKWGRSSRPQMAPGLVAQLARQATVRSWACPSGRARARSRSPASRGSSCTSPPASGPRGREKCEPSGCGGLGPEAEGFSGEEF